MYLDRKPRLLAPRTGKLPARPSPRLPQSTSSPVQRAPVPLRWRQRQSFVSHTRPPRVPTSVLYVTPPNRRYRSNLGAPTDTLSAQQHRPPSSKLRPTRHRSSYLRSPRRCSSH
ncbi:hypothetical protein C8Q77DRAFT_820805 [Trametes polyzona]|nr:hypothetical protein C8Q77DRAFT_820805 [Trametes polyzona]